MSFLPAWYNANANAAKITARNPIIGRVADFGRLRMLLPHAYRKIDATSNTTNIKTNE